MYYDDKVSFYFGPTAEKSIDLSRMSNTDTTMYAVYFLPYTNNNIFHSVIHESDKNSSTLSFQHIN